MYFWGNHPPPPTKLTRHLYITCMYFAGARFAPLIFSITETSPKLIIWMKIKSYYIYSVGTFKTSNGEHLLAKSRQGHFFQSKQTQRGNLLSYQDCNSNLPLASILLKMFLILSDAVDIIPSRRKKKKSVL